MYIHLSIYIYRENGLPASRAIVQGAKRETASQPASQPASHPASKRVTPQKPEKTAKATKTIEKTTKIKRSVEKAAKPMEKQIF